jgi:hypothetical protein
MAIQLRMRTKLPVVRNFAIHNVKQKLYPKLHYTRLAPDLPPETKYSVNMPGQIEGRNLPIFYNSEHKDILTDCREFVKPKASLSGVEECRESRSLHQRVSRPTHTIHNETGRPKQSSYINCQPLYSSEVQSSYIPSYQIQIQILY